ncbi:hypothetical protein AMAG_09717 [Allomyces macrogynus ATCC 38327]|uniref:Fanconi Anaemia group E protein C-terminal domain-containing protein n=1 Tax=Allomyces macrogynus (strain ATCC 38327) TaxID=578462 RepID=A0A0L0ST52_ALLM3|nr:hypothetical protein AMAG_09717 [Allomyces macrogynus ATCC 38327]|eukprot:KNE65738.1 hypothetical protein AMAG_09717 [Allomyces macrogynus ATCC 38327]
MQRRARWRRERAQRPPDAEQEEELVDAFPDTTAGDIVMSDAQAGDDAFNHDAETAGQDASDSVPQQPASMEQVVTLIRSERLTNETTAPSDGALHQLVSMLSPFPRAQIIDTLTQPSLSEQVLLKTLELRNLPRGIQGCFMELLCRQIQRTEQLPSRPVVTYLSTLAAGDTDQFVAGLFRPLLAGPATGDYPWLVDLIKPLSLAAKATILTSLIAIAPTTSTAVINLHTVLAGTRNLVLPGAKVAVWADQLAQDRGTIKALQSVLRNYGAVLDRDALVRVQTALENAAFTHPLLRSAQSAVQRLLDGK